MSFPATRMCIGSRRSWPVTTKFTVPNSAACSITRWLQLYMSHPRRAAAVSAVILGMLLFPGFSPVSAADGGPPTFTLYGDAGRGWGLNSTSFSTPGPTLTVFLGYPLTIALVGAEPVGSGVKHNCFIDYNGDNIPGVGEPKTGDFNKTNPLTQKLHLDRAGNFTYYCEYHSGTMHGNVLILGVPVPTGGGFNVALIPGIMLLALGGVLIFAVVYHVRAVRAVKRSK